MVHISRLRQPERRLWFALGLSLGIVVAVVVMVVGNSGNACAAPRPTAAPAHQSFPWGARYGMAIPYSVNGTGTCSYPNPPADGMYAALPSSEYLNAAACGSYLDVTGPRGTVRVKVVDRCWSCQGGQIQLGAGAFARIAGGGQGGVGISYRPVVNPALPAPLSFVMKKGSNPYWLSVVAVDHGNPLIRVELRMAGRDWQPLTRADYDNSWIAQQGVGGGPFSARLTDTAGHVTTVQGIRLVLEQVQRTTTWMYGSGAPAPQPPQAQPPTAAATTTAALAPLPVSPPPPATTSESPAPTSSSTRPRSVVGYVPAAVIPSVGANGC